MNRRSFILRLGAAAVAVPTVLTLTSCGDDDGSSGPDANLAATSFQATNSDGSGHEHSITVQCSDLAGTTATYESSETAAHRHMVTLDATQLSDIAAGNTVMVTTNDSHAHTWVIAKGNVC